jgi:phospholipid/cholesterol/gamma-HCH transport system substrate-binding protein
VKIETIVGLFVTGALCIFLYLTFMIGALRFDMARFHSYRAYFDDTSGLDRKDPVKIAGVDVGHVENIVFNPATRMAEIEFWLDKSYVLPSNSRPYIRQEGLLGNKFLEVIPGDPSTGTLLPGGALGFPSQSPPTIGELLGKFGDIASSIQAVATSLENTVGTKDGEKNIKSALDGLASASEHMSSFAQTLDRTMKNNEQNINESLEDFKEAIASIKEDVPKAAQGITSVTTKLSDDTLPAAKSALESFDDASVQARDSFKGAGDILDKVNQGKGVFGKLINEDETYSDLKKTIKSFKEYAAKLESIDVMVDMHSETAVRDWNSKGYFEIRLRPLHDYYYIFQLVADERGTITREVTEFERFDCKGTRLKAPRLQDEYRYPDRLETTRRKKNDILFGFQFAKRFDRLTFRIGLFENTFGSAIDWYVPLPTEHLHWITSLEIFDMKGVNRFDDTRAHVKWINRVYFMQNVYTVFGMTDMISKNQASPFIGGGIRFSDKDLKYLFSALSGASLSSS